MRYEKAALEHLNDILYYTVGDTVTNLLYTLRYLGEPKYIGILRFDWGIHILNTCLILLKCYT